ncbi:MAG: helix-turn-helix transcriptional regulator [Chloroflexi bacterium HGW-Chloroflexi-4]|nr:MAG: helix-turn-helix transcriptional regulator [Chloroflexi bacterium HGW-Chloroflexi-4]
MSDSLILTKLYIPPIRRAIVPRPALIARLNEGLATNRKLTLISAPAGFGKTTLVSEWASRCGRPVAWLSLDEGDNDPTRFLVYIVKAMQTITSKIGADVVAALQSARPPSSESLLTSLLNEIAALPDKFILVLDDYHMLDSKPVDQALTFMVEHMPPQMVLIIATREDPQLPLARLRAHGQLIELRAADLRFTPTEAADFLNQVMGLNLSTDDIAALETRTEGWIAGLQLAALSVQGHHDAASFIQSFTGSHRFILDYLVEEVLQRQPERVSSFLLQTSILDQLYSPLCDAVTEQTDCKEMLKALERDNLFVIPLDDQRQWYRYHHLFADVLLEHLMGTQPEMVAILHSRASEWYEKNGLPHDAIRHALAGKDFERAASLIELEIPETRRNRRGTTVTELGWLKALPDELVRFRPVLCVHYAYALFGGGEVGGVEPWLRDAERWLDSMGDTTGMIVVDNGTFKRLPGMISMLRAARALARGDMPETAKNARRVLDLASEDDHLMIGGAASQLGLAAWTSGDLDAARQMIANGMEHVRLAGYISPAIGNALTLADIQIAQGLLRDAMTTYQKTLKWAEEAGAPILRGAADMYVGMSAIQCEHNDLKTATQHLLTSQALGELASLPQNPYRWCAAMARIKQAQGDLDVALQLLEEAERVYDANFSPNVRPITTRKTRVWIAQGRLGEALRWVHDKGLSADDKPSYLHEYDHITLARVLLALYQNGHTSLSIQETMRLLERLLKAAVERDGMGSVIEIRILQAMAYNAQGNLPDALLSIQQALALAEPQGYVRIFLDEGPSMMEMLREGVVRGIMPDYTGILLAAFETEQLGSAGESPLPTPLAVLPKGHRDGEPLTELLSQRELEVLRMFKTELSGPEIARELAIALSTVRTHTKSIYSKLNVNNRRAAVKRAAELNLT